MVDIRTAMEQKGLAVRPPADPATLRSLQSAFSNPLPTWLLNFLATQDGMSLGPIVGVNPFTRESLTFSPEWIAASAGITKRSLFLNSIGKLECVAFGEHESDFFVEFLAGPLKGYLALICHDREPRMLSHTGSAFLQKTLNYINAGIRNPSTALEQMRFVPNAQDAAAAEQVLADTTLQGRDTEAVMMRDLATEMLRGAGNAA